MILSDTAIFEALDDGSLVIRAEPARRIRSIENRSRPFDRSAVDLRLGSILRVPRPGMAVAIDFAAGNIAQTFDALYDRVTIPANGFALGNEDFVLGLTEEFVKLALPHELEPRAAAKGCLAARVEGKSSMARAGLLVHFTAPTIHAGWEGHITLEIKNLGPRPILLRAGLAICQLILERVDGIPQGGPGQFRGQVDPVGRS